MELIYRFIDKLFGVKTPKQYKEFLKQRYKNNPELEFKDNY